MDETATLATIWSDFWAAWELFREPTLTGICAGACLGWLGVYVVLRRMVFVSAAASQSASLGIVVGFWAKSAWSLVGWLGQAQWWGLLLSVLTLGMLTRGSVGTRRDAWLGAIYVAGAAGTLALAPRVIDELADVNNLIFGSAVAVSSEDFVSSVWLTALTLAVHAWWLRGFAFAAFDPVAASVQRLPVRLLDWTFVINLAMAVAWFTKVIGGLPTFAFCVLPALAATRMCTHLAAALPTAALLGAWAGFAGYFAAFAWRLPVGAAQALVAMLSWVVLELAAQVVVRLRRA